MSPLKDKVISEYKKLIAYLGLGKQVDYSNIIDMINFLEVKHAIDQPQFIYDYLMYNG